MSGIGRFPLFGLSRSSLDACRAEASDNTRSSSGSGDFPLHSDGVATQVEEARAAGPAQMLAARSREHVAADRLHIDRELADRLAGIEQIEDAVARGLGRRAAARGRLVPRRCATRRASSYLWGHCRTSRWRFILVPPQGRTPTWPQQKAL